MAWDPQEASPFMDAWKHGEGQVAPGTALGDFLMNVAKDTQYTKYLEIGTWSGMGSTRCFHLGFLERAGPFVFKSLECNKEKCEMAAMRYTEHPSIQILNSTVVPATAIPSIDELKMIFEDLVEHWHNIDMENLATCSFLEERDFDVVFLDGGEYTTYYEYNELVSKCLSLRMIICDDTNMNKCKKVREELLASPDWKILVDRPDDRNGWCAFVRVVT
jgi:predicted O-methyltransferase YrrM